MIHEGEDPFATPVEDRDPVRRLRGRLVAGVTGWTTYDTADRAVGITVSSIMVDHGPPETVIGLIDPLSEFWDAVTSNRRFVVHVFQAGNRRVADQLAGRYPGPDAKFEGVELHRSDWGPVLQNVETRAYCTLTMHNESGDSVLVRASIDKVDIAEDQADPLVYYRGKYHSLR